MPCNCPVKCPPVAHSVGNVGNAGSFLPPQMGEWEGGRGSILFSGVHPAAQRGAWPQVKVWKALALIWPEPGRWGARRSATGKTRGHQQVSPRLRSQAPCRGETLNCFVAALISCPGQGLGHPELA